MGRFTHTAVPNPGSISWNFEPASFRFGLVGQQHLHLPFVGRRAAIQHCLGPCPSTHGPRAPYGIYSIAAHEVPRPCGMQFKAKGGTWLPSKQTLVKEGISIEMASIGWMVVEAAAAITAGGAAPSLLPRLGPTALLSSARAACSSGGFWSSHPARDFNAWRRPRSWHHGLSEVRCWHWQSTL